MTDKELQKCIRDIERGKEIVKAGRVMLEDISKNSIIDKAWKLKIPGFMLLQVSL